jgi:glutamate-1-semialdehyde 2,1-aminomutase/spore coat polysaccharide biosynthesis protein SpsF
MPLAGVPALVMMLERVRTTQGLDEVVVATTTGPEDDALAQLVQDLGVRVYRGSAPDVLDRLYQAVSNGRVDDDVIVRLTGDCPFIDPDVVNDVVRAILDDPECSYVSNSSPPTFPDGLDAEAMRFWALREAWRRASEPHQREHVTPYLRENPAHYKPLNIRCRLGDLSAQRWTLDEPEDYAFLNAVAERLEPGFRIGDVVALLVREPELQALNQHFRRNEGALRTMKASMDTRAPLRSIAESDQWWARRKGLIPAGTMTLSKGPTQFVDGVAPKYLQSGLGSHVWDVDGNEYIDYPLALGAVTLGYRHPEVDQAIRDQLENSGISFTLMHPLEVRLAEKLREIVPCCEMVRYGKNGSDATSAAVRAARAYTGRPMIARCGYHGWQDWSVDASFGIRSRGVPAEVQELTVAFRYNDPASLEALFEAHPDRIGGVILEPTTTILPHEGFLESVKEIAHKNGAVLIFDEVITGFRLARGGAQEYFGVVPDLCTMGKGLGNGMPISIVMGKAEVMQVFEEIFFSFTFGGETLSLAAALKVIEVMEREDYWAHISRLGTRLKAGCFELIAEYRLDDAVECIGLPQWSLLNFKDADGLNPLMTKSLFQQEVLKRGILFNAVQYLSLSHTEEDIDRTIDAYREAFKVLRFGVDNDCVADLLQGRPIEPVFRHI